MKQPTKDVLREQLVLAADRIIELESEVQILIDADSWTQGYNRGYAVAESHRWWHRFAWWRK